MVARRRERPTYRRAILTYLIAIVGPTLVMLFLGLNSVTRQRQAVATLAAHNALLVTEKLAAGVERKVEELAAACLQDRELALLPGLFDGARSPQEVRKIRSLFDRVISRHRIADQLFLFEGGILRYPLIRTFHAGQTVHDRFE